MMKGRFLPADGVIDRFAFTKLLTSKPVIDILALDSSEKYFEKGNMILRSNLFVDTKSINEDNCMERSIQLKVALYLK